VVPDAAETIYETRPGDAGNPASAPFASAELAILRTLVRQLAAAGNTPRRAWKTAEAAAMLGVTESWLEERARLREVAFTLLGGAYHFTDEHLDAIVAKFEVRPAPRQAAAPPPAPAPGPRPRPRPIDSGKAAVAPLVARSPGAGLRGRRRSA